MIYAGLRVIEDINMVEVVEDWTDVRSPSRARRRRWKGHPQRIRIVRVPKEEAYQFGNTLVMHPEMARKLVAKIEETRK